MIDRTEKNIIKSWNKNLKKPLVSICCIAYNHEKYIQQAMDSFLMQRTDFPFEIIVRDDASTDNTANIIKQYENKFPNIVKPIYEYENQYSKGIRPMPVILKRAIGKYIALCDGDDFWIDKYKIQKQVSFLERNKEFSICFHDFHVFYQATKSFARNSITKDVPSITNVFDLALHNYIQTSTVVFRNNLFDLNLLNYFSTNVSVGDYFLFMLSALHGKIKKIKEVMGVYRVHSKSVWLNLDNIQKRLIFIRTLEQMIPHFPLEIQELLRAQISHNYLKIYLFNPIKFKYLFKIKVNLVAKLVVKRLLLQYSSCLNWAR